MPGPERPDPSQPFSEERERLRRVLGFPETVESAAPLTRRPEQAHQQHEDREREVTPSPAPAPAPPPPDPVTARADDAALTQRLDQLSSRLSVLAGLVEALFDRVDMSPPSAMTADEFADIATRMVGVIQDRLDTQREHLEDTITSASIQHPVAVVVDDGSEGGAGLAMLDDHVAMLGRTLLDVEKVLERLDHAPSEVQEVAILAHVDRWFEETNSRLAVDVDQVRGEFNRLEQHLLEIQRAMAERPTALVPENTPAIDVEQLRGEFNRLEQHLLEIQRAMAEPPMVLAVPENTPAIDVEQLKEWQRSLVESQSTRLDPALLDQMSTRLEETSAALVQKFDDLLSSRVQRFEALSQSMMTLVGDPVDALSERLNQLAKAQDSSPTVLQGIGEVAQIQAQLGAALASVRQEGAERDALLRDILERLDRLSAGRPDRH